jgi:hypothetical protein
MITPFTPEEVWGVRLTPMLNVAELAYARNAGEGIASMMTVSSSLTLSSYILHNRSELSLDAVSQCRSIVVSQYCSAPLQSCFGRYHSRAGKVAYPPQDHMHRQQTHRPR